MAVLSLALMALVLLSVRRAHIRVEYSVSWLTAAAVLLFLSRYRALMSGFAQWLEIRDATVALLLIALSVFLMVFYRFSVVMSKLKDNNIALAQRVAILEFHIASLKLNEKRFQEPAPERGGETGS
jgi:hypothetical protein